mgnify:CR=1 FL=1
MYVLNFLYICSMKLENLKTIRDRLNANKSRLAQETQVKLNKYTNHEYIQELEELIQEDQEKIKIWEELQEELQKNI